MKVYYPSDIGKAYPPGQEPALLAIGDSWFWYPRNNLLESLVRHPKLRPSFSFIQALGMNGAKLHEYTTGSYAKQLKFELAPQNVVGLSGVLISGAGNDAVDYRLALKTDCSQQTTAADCIDEIAMAMLCGDISRDLGGLIHDIWWAFNGVGHRAPIFINGYDDPVPDGRGFSAVFGIVHQGPWLKPAMDVARVPPDPVLRKAIAALLIDRLAATFEAFEDPTKDVHYVNSRGTLRTSHADYQKDWDNELHPTTTGFDQIVDQCWIPAIGPLNWAT